MGEGDDRHARSKVAPPPHFLVSMPSLRPVSLRLGTQSQADGSAEMRQGLSHVLASVFGPVAEPRVKEELIDRARVVVTVESATGGRGGDRERMIEMLVQTTLESSIVAHLHPRTLIRIAVHLLHDDGAIAALAVNAAVMALVDAGVPMRTVPTAAACAILATDDDAPEIILDPTLEQETASSAALAFSFATAKSASASLASSAEGAFSAAELDAAAATTGAGANTMRVMLRSFVNKTVQ